MNEELFKSILEEMVMSEYAEIENEPDHKFSRKHRLAMKRIFARYERNVRKLRAKEPAPTAQIVENKPRYRLSRQVFLAMIVIILASFLVGWVVVYVSTNFHGTVYHDYTDLTPKKTMDCPQTIEYKYDLVYIPDGFEQIKAVTSRTNVYTKYKNKSTNQTISISQWVKTHYEPNINTEHCSLEEIDVNGKKGVCIDFSDNTRTQSLVVWDNGDYVIEVVADLDKESIINLSKINKI